MTRDEWIKQERGTWGIVELAPLLRCWEAARRAAIEECQTLVLDLIPIADKAFSDAKSEWRQNIAYRDGLVLEGIAKAIGGLLGPGEGREG